MVELGWVDGKVLVSAVELLEETMDDVEETVTDVSVTSSTAMVVLLLGVGVSKKHSWLQYPQRPWTYSMSWSREVGHQLSPPSTSTQVWWVRPV